LQFIWPHMSRSLYRFFVILVGFHPSESMP
jgi:hypothetical protein